MIKSFKLNIIISAAAILLNLMILTIGDQVFHADMANVMKICVAVSVITIAVTVGIFKFGRAMIKSFYIGFLIPIWPMNLMIGAMLAGFVFAISIMIPVVPVIIAALAKLEG